MHYNKLLKLNLLLQINIQIYVLSHSSCCETHIYNSMTKRDSRIQYKKMSIIVPFEECCWYQGDHLSQPLIEVRDAVHLPTWCYLSQWMSENTSFIPSVFKNLNL